KLCKKEGRAQIAHQPFVEKRPAIVDLAHAGENAAVGRNIALAAGGRHDHVGVVEKLGLAGKAGGRKRQTRRLDAAPPPQPHLPRVALFRNLLVEIHRAERMHDKRRKALVVIGRSIAALQMSPCRIEPFTEATNETDARDPHLTAVAHVPGSLAASAKNSLPGTSMRSATSSIAWRNWTFGI